MPENLSEIGANNTASTTPQFRPASLEEIQQNAANREINEKTKENTENFGDAIDFDLVESKIKEFKDGYDKLPIGEEKNIDNLTFNAVGMEMRVKAEITDENGKKYTEYFTYDRNYRLKNSKDLELEFVMGDYGEQGIISSQKYSDHEKRKDFQESLEEGHSGVVSKKDIEKKIEEAGLEGQDAEEARQQSENEFDNGEQGNGAARMGSIGEMAVEKLKAEGGQVIQANRIITGDPDNANKRGLTYNDISNTAKGAVDYVIITKKGVFEVKEGKDGPIVHKTDRFYQAGINKVHTNDVPNHGEEQANVLMSRDSNAGFAIGTSTNSTPNPKTYAVFKEGDHLHGSEIQGSVETTQQPNEQGDNTQQTTFTSNVNTNGYEQSYLVELYNDFIPQGFSREDINGIFQEKMVNGAYRDIKDAYDMTVQELNERLEEKGNNSLGDKVWDQHLKEHGEKEHNIGPQHPVD